jgi:hypothetical protein
MKELPDFAERFVGRVRDLLGGDRAARKICHELRDHLVCAHEDGDPDLADRRVAEALTAIGSSSSFADEMRPFVVRRRLRVHAAWNLAVGVAIGVAWIVALAWGPHAPWSEAAEPLHLEASDSLGVLLLLASLVLGVITLAMVTLPSTEPTITQKAQQLIFQADSGLAIGSTLLVVYALMRGFAAPASVEWSDILTASVVTVVLLAGLLRVHARKPRARANVVPEPA